MKKESVEILIRAIERERAARKEAENILEEKSAELLDAIYQLEAVNEDLNERLDKKQAELKGVFDNIIDAFVVLDLRGNVLRMNTAAEIVFGYKKGELLNILNLLHEDDHEYSLEVYKKLLKQGIYTKYRVRIKTGDKTEKMLEINTSLIYDNFRNPIALQSIARDVTEEVKNIKLIKEQQEQLSVTVDNSPLGIVLTARGRLIKFNKAFHNFLGYSEEELLNSFIQNEITHPDDLEESSTNFKKMQEGKLDTYNVKKRYIKKNGEIVWARLYVSAVRNEDKSIKYEIGLVEDISEQLKIESYNKRLLKSLELRNNELQEYAHVVSHDLKSPLRSISALTSWLKEDYADILDEEGVNNINMIESTVEKMDRLIADILNYSSISSNQTVVEEINVYEVVNHVKSLIFIPKHVEVKVAKNLPIVKSDKTRVQQLFQNLMSNAVNYIDKEKGEVIVDHKEEDGHYIFRVKDNGIGIPKEYHKKIFDIFQSLGNHKDSSGIGLSIVKKIVDMYDGSIWLESKEGEGTTFYIKFKK